MNIDELNYYSLLKSEHLDPAQSRLFNYKRLSAASSNWNTKYGHDADVMKTLITAALDTFSDDTKYLPYRQKYVKMQLQSFINGAKWLNDKTEEVIEPWKNIELDTLANQYGIDKNEVTTLLNQENIKIEQRKTQQTQSTQSSQSSQQQSQSSQSSQRTKQQSSHRRQKINPKIIFSIITVLIIVLASVYYYRKDATSASTSNKISVETAKEWVSEDPPVYSKIIKATNVLLSNSSQKNTSDALAKTVVILSKFSQDFYNVGDLNKQKECDDLLKKCKEVIK